MAEHVAKNIVHAAPKSTSVVACQGLTKVFKDFWMRSRVRAVDNLTFDIQAHEVFGLLGPNGSGKSTTIKMILGLLQKTSGRVVVFGKAPTDVQTKRRIGYLPEESYLYPFLNARETLDYYGKLFGLERRLRMRRIDELLEMVGLTAAQFRPVNEYSKGMQRRIGLAQALINDPDFLILDEPTSGLDPIGTRQVKDLILELGRRGKTVLLSSHLLADVEDVVDRMVILYGGKIRQEGTCESLLEEENKTSIETDALDDATIAEIDSLIRSRSNGDRSILRVSRPRQKLEELFLDIVEQAHAERLETYGVTQGGQTASFLKATQGTDGEQLIESLVQAADEPLVDAMALEPTEQEPEEPADNVIESLLSTDSQAPSEPAPVQEQTRRAAGAPKSGADVDRSLIDNLLGNDEDAQDEGLSS